MNMTEPGSDQFLQLVFDAFGEIGNIAMGSAVTSLSNIFPCSREIHQLIRVCELDTFHSMIPEEIREEKAVGAVVSFAGDFFGELLFIFREPFARQCLKSLLRREPIRVLGDTEAYIALAEIANLMASAYLSAISFYTHGRAEILNTVLAEDMVGAMTVECAGRSIFFGNRAVSIEGEFMAADTKNYIVLLLREAERLSLEKCLGLRK